MGVSSSHVSPRRVEAEQSLFGRQDREGFFCLPRVTPNILVPENPFRSGSAKEGVALSQHSSFTHSKIMGVISGGRREPHATKNHLSPF